MVSNSRKIRDLVNFKKKLEKRIQELQVEIEENVNLLKIVDSILLEKGFKRGDIEEVKLQKQKAKPTIKVKVEKKKAIIPRTTEFESVIPLKTKENEPLAIMYVDDQVLHILPDESKKFSINTPPFTSFLVERVLSKMEEKDRKLAKIGELALSKMFEYNIIREGDLIREILIKNIDDERLRELQSSIRWTLEKMYEKKQS